MGSAAVQALWTSVLEELGAHNAPAVGWLTATSAAVQDRATDACSWFQHDGALLPRWLVVLNEATCALEAERSALAAENAELREQAAASELASVTLALALGCVVQFCLQDDNDGVEVWGCVTMVRGTPMAWLTLEEDGVPQAAPLGNPARALAVAGFLRANAALLQDLETPLPWLCVSAGDDPCLAGLAPVARVEALLETWFRSSSLVRFDNLAHALAHEPLPAFAMQHARERRTARTAVLSP